MPLAKQIIPVLVRGLSTKRDPKVGLPGELRTLQNCRLTRTADSGVEVGKRYGWTSLSRAIDGGGTLSSGSILGARSTEMYQISNGAVYSYSPTLADWKTSTTTLKAAGSGVTVQAQTAFNPGLARLETADTAALGSLLVVAWYVNALGVVTTYVRGYDSTTNHELFSDSQTGGTGGAKCVAGTSNVLVFVQDFAASAVRVYRYTSAGLAASALLASDVSATNPHMDAWRDPITGTFFCAYFSTTGTRVVRVTEALSVSATVLVHATSGTNGVGWLTHDGADGNGYIALGSAGAVRVVTVSTATGAATADNTCINAVPAFVWNVTGYRSGGVSTVFCHSNAAAPPRYTAHKVVMGTGGGTVGTTILRDVAFTSRPFLVGSAVYMIFAYQASDTSSRQNCYYLRRVDSSSTTDTYRMEAQFLSGYAPVAPFLSGAYNSSSASVAALSATSFVFAALRETVDAGASRISVIRTSFDFSAAATCKPVEKERVSFIPGGIVSVYDGATVLPAGFTVFPETGSLVASTTGAGLLTTLKTYGYVAVYARTDALGRTLRSAPSILTSVTLTGTQNAITVTVPYHHIGNSADEIVEIYRTKGDGTLLYRLDTGQYPNSATTDTLSFLDEISDTTLGTGELLYSTVENGVLPNDTPPPAKFVATWGNYLVLASTENPREYWVSKPYRDGFGMAFSTNLRGWVDDDITGLAAVDDKCVIFTASRIYVLSGEGPNDIGQGMPTAQAVRSGDGTSNHRSIAASGDGVFFANTRGGIYLLDRSLSVSYVGAAVEDFNALPITAAVVRRDVAQVHFLTASGTALVYDWEFQQWATSTNFTAVDGCLWNGTFVHLTSNGTVRQVVVDQYNDDGATIGSTIGFDWLSPFGTQGFGRLYSIEILGEFKGAHTLHASLCYDFSAYSPEAPSIVAAPGAGTYGAWSPYGAEHIYGMGQGAYRAEIRPKVQKCSSLLLTLSDVLSTATQGFTLSAVTLEIGAKGGRARIPSAARMA